MLHSPYLTLCPVFVRFNDTPGQTDAMLHDDFFRTVDEHNLNHSMESMSLEMSQIQDISSSQGDFNALYLNIRSLHAHIKEHEVLLESLSLSWKHGSLSSMKNSVSCPVIILASGQERRGALLCLTPATRPFLVI